MSLATPLGRWNKLVGPWKDTRPSFSTFKPSNARARSSASASILTLAPALELDSATDEGEPTFRSSASPSRRALDNASSSFATLASSCFVYDKVGALGKESAVCVRDPRRSTHKLYTQGSPLVAQREHDGLAPLHLTCRDSTSQLGNLGLLPRGSARTLRLRQASHEKALFRGSVGLGLAIPMVNN